MKPLTLFTIAISMTLIGCSTLPKGSKLLVDKLDVMRLKSFKYGKFCGAGHPDFDSSRPNTPARLSDLEEHWAPIDDIDVLCYAHDICYELTNSNNFECDEALIFTAGHLSYTFDKEAGCGNLARVITAGITAKPETPEGTTVGMKILNVAHRIPLALAYFGTHERELRQFGLPEEGHTCFGLDNKEEISPLFYISFFENAYSNAAEPSFLDKTKAVKPHVKISYPNRSSKSYDKLLVSLTQQYLNEFNYDVGVPDGIMGERTRSALTGYLEASKASELSDNGEPNHAVLGHMKFGMKFVKSAVGWIEKIIDKVE